MGENPSSHSEDRAYEERLKEQKKLEAQKEQSRPPESNTDKQMKVVLSERLPVMREEFQKQVKDWQERVKALREKEYSFSNFVTPENYWGFSTLIRGDGNTNSGAKVDIVEAYSELVGMRNIALPRIEYALKEGKRWEDIQKDPLMKSFLDSPEGRLMTSQSSSPDEAMADFYLDKARELRKKIPKGELLAQPLYEKLKGTKHEAIAKQEMMNIAEEIWKKYVSEIGNELLGTDSLLVMAASGPVGGLISKGIKSERMIQASVGTMEAVNTSRLAKVLVPGVKVVQTEASNGTLMKVGKGAVNILADAGKIGAYHEAVRYFGGDEAAKIAGYVLLFIPGAKAGFERDMKAKFGTVAPNSANVSAWALEKFGEEKLKKMLYDTSLEQMKQSGKITPPERLKNGVNLDVIDEVEQVVVKMKEIAATATKNTTATEIGAQGVRATAERVQSTLPQIQEGVKTKVAETLGKGEQIRELIKLGIPENYIKAIQEIGIPESKIATKYKNWKTDPEYKALVESTAQKHGMTLEEAHAVYGYTLGLFNKELNMGMRSGNLRNSEMAKLLQSGLEKMPQAQHTIQFIGDSHNFGGLKKGDTKTLDWFTSASNPPTEPFWNNGTYQITVINATQAKDISDLAFFVQFAQKINKTNTPQESLFLPGTKIEILKIEPQTTPDGKTTYKILASQIP
ncbi:MAG: hypothetical protein HHAS10_04450 [Candidatus Altimarinota bacterium]